MNLSIGYWVSFRLRGRGYKMAFKTKRKSLIGKNDMIIDNAVKDGWSFLEREARQAKKTKNTLTDY